MAYAARPTDFQGNIAPSCGGIDAKTAPRPSFWSRLLNAVFESREREAERVAKAYLARTGYRFTDSIEREINNRAFNGGWKFRR